ncbi:hypothetical protein [Phascolarctobacterium faecium]|uniref:hypothetical protein n=1 Tax=Phascolarctobacterium faecium TaxID=33025 RepID=UPI00300F0AB7
MQGTGYYDGIAVALGTNAALTYFDKGALTIKARGNIRLLMIYLLLILLQEAT